jgi:hypothetical protein
VVLRIPLLLALEAENVHIVCSPAKRGQYRLDQLAAGQERATLRNAHAH